MNKIILKKNLFYRKPRLEIPRPSFRPFATWENGDTTTTDGERATNDNDTSGGIYKFGKTTTIKP
jgi:hypothetical protein